MNKKTYMGHFHKQTGPSEALPLFHEY